MKKLFLIFISLCFISSTIFAQENEKLKLEVEKMNKTLVTAMLANDTETMMSMYTDDIISMPSYQPTVTGIAKVRELSEMQAKSGWKTTSFVLDNTDMIFSGNLIIEIGTYDMTMSGPNMPEWVDNGKYMTIWEQQIDGSLKIKVETWNTNTNPWAQMEEAKKEEMKN